MLSLPLSDQYLPVPLVSVPLLSMLLMLLEIDALHLSDTASALVHCTLLFDACTEQQFSRTWEATQWVRCAAPTKYLLDALHL